MGDKGQGCVFLPQGQFVVTGSYLLRQQMHFEYKAFDFNLYDY